MQSCRNAVQPDVTFYAALIEVAGAAGELETAFKIFADAERYKLPQQVSNACSLLFITFPSREQSISGHVQGDLTIFGDLLQPGNAA